MANFIRNNFTKISKPIIPVLTTSFSLKLFLNNLLKDGNKPAAFGVFCHIFFLIKVFYGLNPFVFLFSLFLDIVFVLYFRKKKLAGATYSIPVYPGIKRGFSIGLKFFLSICSRMSSPFSVAFVREAFAVLKQHIPNSSFLKDRKTFYLRILDSRVYIKFM